MVKCPYCGHENNDEAVNCERCKAGIPHEELTNTNNETEKVSRRKNKE